jgi:hypothetical protein
MLPGRWVRGAVNGPPPRGHAGPADDRSRVSHGSTTYSRDNRDAVSPTRSNGSQRHPERPMSGQKPPSRPIAGADRSAREGQLDVSKYRFISKLDYDCSSGDRCVACTCRLCSSATEQTMGVAWPCSLRERREQEKLLAHLQARVWAFGSRRDGRMALPNGHAHPGSGASRHTHSVPQAARGRDRRRDRRPIRRPRYVYVLSPRPAPPRPSLNGEEWSGDYIYYHDTVVILQCMPARPTARSRQRTSPSTTSALCHWSPAYTPV